MILGNLAEKPNKRHIVHPTDDQRQKMPKYVRPRKRPDPGRSLENYKYFLERELFSCQTQAEREVVRDELVKTYKAIQEAVV